MVLKMFAVWHRESYCILATRWDGQGVQFINQTVNDYN